jgi:hypothetical protein
MSPKNGLNTDLIHMTVSVFKALSALLVVTGKVRIGKVRIGKAR